MSFISKEELIKASLEYQSEVVGKFNMSPNHVVKLPLLEQINYADNITKKYCNDERFLRECMKNFRGIDENTNACAIGNLAYLGYIHNNEMILTVLAKLRE